jgi:hypothetical protein
MAFLSNPKAFITGLVLCVGILIASGVTMFALEPIDSGFSNQTAGFIPNSTITYANSNARGHAEFVAETAVFAPFIGLLTNYRYLIAYALIPIAFIIFLWGCFAEQAVEVDTTRARLGR